MNKEELENLIWDTIQAYLQNSPSIRNEEELEDILMGVEKQIALEILTKISTGSTIADYVEKQMKGKENG